MTERGGQGVRLREVLGADVLEWAGDPAVEIGAIIHDSRDSGPGACFACIPGAVTDGHEHAPAAVAAGAVALVVERILPLDVTQARVESVRRVLGPAASRFFGSPSRSMRCLGVTGTNGKTTTTYLLEAIAAAAGDRVGLIGTTGARIAGVSVPGERTTPEATDLQALLARMRDAGVATVAMEVSSHALDQHRVDGTWFAVACFTNFSHEHLDYHGTLAGYFAAKLALFDPERAGCAAVNLDDPRGVEVARRARAAALPVLAFSTTGQEADVVAESVESGHHGSRFALVDRRGDMARRRVVTLPLVGRLNVDNALAAATTALGAGLPLDAVVAGLEAPPVIPGRMERVDGGQDFVVLVDYAHTPDALGRVLDTAHSLAGEGRVVVVFGCGGDRDREKRPLMGRVAGAGADLTIVTSDNPRSEDPGEIADAVSAGLSAVGAAHVVDLDRRAAIRRALSEARPADVVVIAGKGHETGQTAQGRTRPFDDRVVAREELGALGWS
jgi:UDP-N-acetylmuramoyl-L-alanyl-D-glutamate--2,6-diaminopimelate ligase